jgi:hypothetical protein
MKVTNFIGLNPVKGLKIRDYKIGRQVHTLKVIDLKPFAKRYECYSYR